MNKKIINIIKKPYKILLYLDNKRIIKLPDKIYLKYRYRDWMNKKLNLNKPQTLNEKLQWLKLNDRNPEYTKMVDKFEVKEYVANIIGEEYIIPTIGVWDKFEDIDFEKLPNQFVFKCTHDSGGLVICKDKNKLDKEIIKKKIKKSLKNNYYYAGREWPYKNVKPRIIAEKYMENKNGTDICDYKFYCFKGKVDYVMICTGRYEKEGVKFYYYNREWELQTDMSQDGKKATKDFSIERPENLDKMFNIAEKLSKGLKFVRVDLYDIDNKIYFGELTFYPSAGFDNTRTQECDEILSQNLELF